MAWYDFAVEIYDTAEALYFDIDEGLGGEGRPSEPVAYTPPATVPTLNQDKANRPDQTDAIWLEALRAYYPELVKRAFGERFDQITADQEQLKANDGDSISSEHIEIMRIMSEARGYAPSGITAENWPAVQALMWAYYLKYYTPYTCDLAGCTVYNPTTKKHDPAPAPPASDWFVGLLTGITQRLQSGYTFPTSYPAGPDTPRADHPKPKVAKPEGTGSTQQQGVTLLRRAMIEVLRPYVPMAAECAILKPCNDAQRTKELAAVAPEVREFFHIVAISAMDEKLDPTPPLMGKPTPWHEADWDMGPGGWDGLKVMVANRMTDLGIYPADFDRLWRSAVARAEAGPMRELPKAPSEDSGGMGNALVLLALFWVLTKKK